MLLLLFFASFALRLRNSASPLNKKSRTLVKNPRKGKSQNGYQHHKAAEQSEPIRIYFDYDFLSNGKDPYMCQEPGKTIIWNGQEFTCTDGDIMTATKLKAIKETFDNLARFLADVLKVSPSQPFNPATLLADVEDPPVVRDEEISTDLYIPVLARPFSNESSIIAQASPLALDDTNLNRPMIGEIYINLPMIPDFSSSFETQTDRSFFETAMHEIIHVLAFNIDLFDRFVDRQTQVLYNSSFIYDCSNISYPDIKFKVISTPKLHEIATLRYGQEYFFENCPAGALLEQYGDESTVDMHFDQLIYMNELMVSADIGLRKQISEFTLGLLYDSGWYDVNFSFAEPLYYGDYRAIIGRTSPFIGFSTAPPNSVFPEGYLFDGSNTQKCVFDYSSYGIQLPFSGYCCQDDDNSTGGQCVQDCDLDPRICSNTEYYDPEQSGEVPCQSELFDFQKIYIPNPDKICFKLDSVQEKNFKSSYGPGTFCVDHVEIDQHQAADGLCYKMTCDYNNTLSVYVENQVGICNKKDEVVKINGVSIQCPDPAIICGILNYRNSHSTTLFIKDQCSNEVNCVNPDKISDYSFDLLALSFASITLDIQTQLSSTQVFNFNSLSKKSNISIIGKGSAVSRIYLDLSQFGSNIDTLTIDNITVAFATSTENSIKCNSLILKENLTLQLPTNKIDISAVKYKYFSKISFYNSFIINDSANFNFEDNTINQIEVDSNDIIIHSSRGANEAATFSNTNGGILTISSKETELILSFSATNKKYINLVPLTNEMTINALNTRTDSRFCVSSYRKTISLVIPRNSGIDLRGSGTIMLSSNASTENVRINSLRPYSLMNIALSNFLLDVFIHSLVFNASNSKLSLYSQNNPQLIIRQVEVNENCRSVINATSLVYNSINIKEKGQLIFLTTPAFGSSLEIKHAYSSALNQRMPVIRIPSYYNNGIIRNITLSRGTGFDPNKDKILNDISIIRMTKNQYDQVNFQDTSSKYFKGYMNHSLYATLTPSNENEDDDIAELLIIILVPCGTVIVGVSSGLTIYISKKKKKEGGQIETSSVKDLPQTLNQPML